MSVLEMSHIDLEQGSHRRSFAGSDGTSFSDADDGSCYSQFYSTVGGSYDDYSFACVCDADGAVLDSRRVSSVSDYSVMVGIENGDAGGAETKVQQDKVERDCRICHLGLESNSHESGAPIELGCSCKDDLAAAHKQCAEAWFKIRGNKTCEICHSIAHNVVGINEGETAEQSNEPNNASTTAASVSVSAPLETRSFWHGQRFLNVMLAVMVFAFVISWLFHFNIPSS